MLKINVFIIFVACFLIVACDARIEVRERREDSAKNSGINSDSHDQQKLSEETERIIVEEFERIKETGRCEKPN